MSGYFCTDQYEAIQPQIPERQNLQDLFFAEKLQYPAFAWQEAIVNAVAHRDYGIQGAGVEVWMFDDRLEVRSPGLPPAPVTVEALSRREHLHLSRNPILVRVLVELGFMRELGEGIPRMFDEMERAGYYPPILSIVGGMSFQVTLRNQPVYDRATLEWLRQFDTLALSLDQKRILASAHAHDDRFTSRDVQAQLGIDIYGASALIKDLVRRGAIQSSGKGSRIYHVRRPLQTQPDMPAQLARILPILNRRGHLRNQDLQGELNMTRITASRALKEWVADQWLARPAKRGRGAVYSPGSRLLHQPQIASGKPETDAIGSESDTIPGQR
jgi:ATP-dependent DNA helicase RecG